MFNYKLRVYYEDTDTGGVVYHSNYINFCERARSEMFFANNYPLSVDGYQFMVKKINAQYIKPAFLGDMILVKTKILEMKKASFLLSQEIFRENELLFSADILIVYTKDTKPARMNESLISFLLEHG